MAYGPIVTLLQKYLREELTLAEAERLDAWADEHADNRGLMDSLADDAWLRNELLAFDALAPAHAEREAAGIAGRILIREKRKRAGIRRWLPYAAAAILLAVGWLLLVDSRQSTVDSLAATDILPGGNRATLTLADGRVINLDEAQTGIVVGAEDITYDDGSAVSPADSPHAGLTTYDLQLTTPKGGTYQITLPDGSRVWLNANSTLKYPSRFTGDSREVILEGEAFFDIQEIQGTPKAFGTPASNADFPGARVSRVPFNVLTSGQTVEVLGTQFNISAYPDDPETKTTLVTGKVRVDVGANKHSPNNHSPDKSSVTLTPGQQATTRGTATTINNVDVDQYASWKDGFFYLEGTIPTILKEISRWYDIEVVYEDEIDEPVNLAITFPRDRALGDVLHVLQRAVPAMRYRVEEIKRSNKQDVEPRAERRLTIYR